MNQFIRAMVLPIGLLLPLSTALSSKWVPKYLEGDASTKKNKQQLRPSVTAIPKIKTKKAPDGKVAVKNESKLPSDPIEKRFLKELKDKNEIIALKKEVLAIGPKAVPVLVRIMKGGNFPIKSRWIATFLLGRIMGKKSSGFISKFASHPHYVLRMASLKTLLAIKEDKKVGIYQNALTDKSMLVRFQALENISKMGLTNLGPSVWKMIFEKENYNGKKGKLKRTAIIKKVVRTLGDIKFAKVKAPLLKMIKKKSYNDIFKDLDYSLSKLTGKSSPKGGRDLKRSFWGKL
ncbi:MAG: HEAT repeat domain-containing protein [Bacteriovoracaceae bacterium]|jgi:hypothetical protein|nr:HEAT repeat domain-containing protein [Bacteriovoracaceae bacterium]